MISCSNRNKAAEFRRFVLESFSAAVRVRARARHGHHVLVQFLYSYPEVKDGAVLIRRLCFSGTNRRYGGTVQDF